MKRALIIIAWWLLSLSAWGQVAVIGSWEGQLKVTPQYTLTVVIHISEEEGTLTATMDSPDQGATGLPIDQIAFEGSQLTFSSEKMMIVYEGDLKEGKIVGTFTQNGYAIPLTLERKQPEEPKEIVPLPYISEDISITNPESGLKIAGTLTRPSGKGSFPAVVLIAGSGPMDRDSRVMHHTPLADLADYLTRQGIVVIRYDKRGIKQSEGDIRTATLEDFASDATAVLLELRKMEFVTEGQIGVIGHSEGGMMAQMISTSHPELTDFIVMLATPGTPLVDVLVFQNILSLQDYIEEEQLDNIRNGCRDLFIKIGQEDATRESDSLNLIAFNEKVIAATKPDFKAVLSKTLSDPKNIERNLSLYRTPYFQEFIRFVPATYLSKVRCRALALNGSKDMQVPADENLSAIKAVMGENVITKTMKNLNHLFIEAKSGSVLEYPTLQGSFSEDAMHFIASWIKENL